MKISYAYVRPIRLRTRAEFNPKTKNFKVMGDVALDCRGGWTIAYEMSEGRVVAYSLAKCRNDEHFIRRMGRAIAVDRLIDPFDRVNCDLSREEFFTEIVGSLKA